MNWKLSFQLSAFGFIMACGTVSLIPFMMEPFFWIAIFIISAFVIAKACSKKHFVQGLWAGLFNCIWVTSAHFIFFTTYAANHRLELIYPHPRIMTVVTGPIAGLLSGCVIGLFAWIASKIVKPNAVA